MKLLTILLFCVSFSAFGNENFDKVLSNYELLHKAFFANDLSQVKEAAKKVRSAIREIKDEKIQKTLAFSVKKLELIEKSDDLSASQKAFDTASQGILVVLEKQAPNSSYARYYCPMVKKYWIQNISKSEIVMNPYASQSMPQCGSRKGSKEPADFQH